MDIRSSVLVALVLVAACAEPSPCATGPDFLIAPRPDEFRFVAIGDQGRGAAEQQPVADGMATKCGADGCDFGVLLGDNFYPSGVEGVDDPLFEDMFTQPYGALGFPFYVSLGNHDYGTDGVGWRFSKADAQIEYSDRNPDWILPAHCYAFSAGVARMLALGTNLLIWDYDDAVRRQGKFFRGQLRDAGEPWRIAFGHHPYRSNGRHGNAGHYDKTSWPPQSSGQYVKEFVEQNLCGEVDVFLQGHDHDRQVLAPVDARCPMHLVVSGAAARTREIPGGPNPSLFSSSELGFAWLHVTPDSLTIEMLDANGTTEYSQTIPR